MYLRHADHPGALGLSQALVIAQLYHCTLPLGQQFQRALQGQAFHRFLFQSIVSQQSLQNQSALSRLTLKRQDRLRRQLGGSYLLWLQPSLLRQLGQRRLPAQALLQPDLCGPNQSGPLLHSPAHLYRSVIPQEASDLPGNFGYGIGGKLGSEPRIKPLYRLYKAQAAQLIQVIHLHAPAAVPAHHRPNQPLVLLQYLLAGPVIPFPGRPQQFRSRGRSIHRPSRRRMRRVSVTLVPFPG